MKDSARYVKVVEWSDEDQCYVGSAPGLIYGGCHGPDEKVVFEKLCVIVDEAIALYRQEGKPLPASTGGQRLREHAAERMITAWSESATGGVACVALER